MDCTLTGKQLTRKAAKACTDIPVVPRGTHRSPSSGLLSLPVSLKPGLVPKIAVATWTQTGEKEPLFLTTELIARRG